MSGAYIAFEGMEGAGKSTCAKEVYDALVKEGHKVVFVQEPGSTPMAMDIRALVKKEYDEKVDDMTELLLFFAARKQLLVNIVIPALKQGCIVISDRSFLSSMAYQGYGGGLNIECDKLIAMVVGDTVPDLTIYMDVPVQVGLERARNRAALDRIELKDLEYFNRARDRFLMEAKYNLSVKQIDATQNTADNLIDALTLVEQLLAKKEIAVWSQPE